MLESLLMCALIENTLVETLPKVLVTQRNSSSISIAFDDFKPSIYNLGYGIKFRLTSNDSQSNNQSWNVVSSNSSRPFYVLSHLKPNTYYQIQVFTWDNFGEQARSHSEIVNASTLDGCVYQNGTFPIGAKVLTDCSQTCTCHAGGSLSCIERYIVF